MKKTNAVALSLFLLWSAGAGADSPPVANEYLSAVVTDSGGFEVTDLRTGRTWTTWPMDNGHAPQGLSVDGNTITWRDPAGWDCTLTLEPDAPELAFELDGDREATLYSIDYPYPFYLDTAAARVALPSFDGLLLPVREWTDKDWKGPTSARWVGLVDIEQGWGCMTITDTYADDEFIKVLAEDGQGQDLLTFKVRHKGEKHQLGYTRKQTYWFNDTGGYVAQAKRYRQWAKDNGYFRPLTQKAVQNPEVNKLKGIVDIYPQWVGRLGDFTDWLAALGIDRAMISPYSKAHEDVWLPSLAYEDDVTDAIAQGYVVTSYDIYTDCPEPLAPPGPWLTYERYRQLTFPDDTVKTSSGSAQVGWYAFWDNDYGSVQTYVACPEIRYRNIQEYLPGHRLRYPANAHFVDCETKVYPYECWDPVHPHTRRDDYYYRKQLLGYISGAAPGQHNLIAGSEGGQFWALPEATYAEDIMSVTAAQWWQGAAPVPKAMEGPVYYDLCPYYRRFELGQDVRVPLFQLAFHDCLVTSARWTQGHLRGFEDMWKKDLFNLLCGTAPMWMMRAEGMAFAQDDAWRMKKTFETVCEVNKYTQFDEMLDHEFVNFPENNGDVHRTTWESGLRITVNFSDAATHTVGSYELPPASYVLEGDAATYPTLPLNRVQRVPLDWSPREESWTPVRGGGFEGKSIPFWRKTTLAALDFVDDRAQAHSGDVALRVDARGPDGLGVNSWTMAYCPVSGLVPGKAYRMTVWMKVLEYTGENGDFPRLAFVSMDDNYPDAPVWHALRFPDPPGVPAINTWIKWQHTFTVPAEHLYGFLSFDRWTPDLDPALFLVDDITVEPFGWVQYSPADVNRDGFVNAIDVQLVVNSALALPTDYICDINNDTSTDAMDLQLVINAALGLPITL